MAGDSDKTKQVLFVGAWRAQQVTDQLLRQISKQIGSKNKVVTNLSITAEGLELLLLNSIGQVTRKDKIALENVVDFIDNKYSTTCTLAIVRDRQRKVYTVFVFQCKSDRDAAVLIHNFKTTKRQLSGEGYNTTLTPKGKNWTLQQSTGQTANGDINGRLVTAVPRTDVQVISTEKQNGGVTIINTADRHDSISRESSKTSSSEVKEELHQLADEVRDIKRLLQGSRGRAQFEKHYNYRILQSPPVPELQRQTEYIEKEISTRPVEVRRENLYVKNENNARYVETAPQVIRVGGRVARSTRRLKTKGHFVTATSPTRAEYTKRVYDSSNPLVENGQRIQPVKVITRNTQPVFVPRARHYTSQSSDIVHRNIEDVYRSRSLRKVYMPPSPNGNVVDYANSQMVQDFRQAPTKTSVTNETEHNTVHVKYNPEVRTYYDTSTVNANEESNSLNVSTDVNTYVNDSHEATFNRDENVIFVKTEIEDPKVSEEASKHVVYVEDNNAEQPSVSDGNVYHVRAEYTGDNQRTIGNYENLTLIKAETTEVRSKHTELVENIDDVQNVERTVSFDDKLTKANDVDENTGLFGAYVRKPEEHDTRRNEISSVVAYRYHEDDLIEPDANRGSVYQVPDEFADDNERLIDTNEDFAIFEANTTAERSENMETVDMIENEQEVQRNVTFDDEITSERDDIDIEENKVNILHSKIEDDGLFGAYTKTPDEYDEPKNEVADEMAYRYYENDMNSEENGVGQLDIQESLERAEEKHVRYDENIDQIPLVVGKSEHSVENMPVRDVYTVDNHVGGQESGFQNELSAVVSKLRHRYDEKLKEDSGHDISNKENDEKYEFDMNALKAYSAEPDIIIVDSNNKKSPSVLPFENKLPIQDGDTLNFDQVETTFMEKRGSLENSTSAVSEQFIGKKDEFLQHTEGSVTENIRSGTEQFVSKKDEILENTEGRLTETLRSGTEQLESKTDEFLEQTEGSVTDTLRSGTEQLESKKDEFLEQTEGSVTDTLRSGTEQLVSKKDEFLEQTEGSVTEKLRSGTEQLVDKKDEFFEQTDGVSEKLRNGTEQLINKKDEFLEQAGGSVTEKLRSGTEQLMSKKDELLETAGGSVTEKLRSGTEQLVSKKDEIFKVAEGSLLF